MARSRLHLQEHDDGSPVDPLDFRRALWLNQFDVYYQPVVDVSTGELAGAEALVRWRHPLRGVLPAARFVPDAVDTEYIHSLGRRVMGLAIQFRGAWRVSAEHPLHVAINLSAPEVTAPEVVETIVRLTQAAGIPTSYVEIELDASSVAANEQAATAAMAALSEAGVAITLDDLETLPEASELAAKWPVDAVKVDLRDSLDTGAPGAFEVFVASAQALGIEVIAKRLETHEQLVVLRQCGVRRAQGFVLGPPVPEHQFTELLIDSGLRPPDAAPVPVIDVNAVRWGSEPQASRSA